MALCASPHVLRANVRGRSVLLDLRSRRCFALNDTGATIWRGLERCHAQEDLVKDLCRAFAVSEPEATVSVSDFLSQLTDHNLLAGETHRSGR